MAALKKLKAVLYVLLFLVLQACQPEDSGGQVSESGISPSDTSGLKSIQVFEDFVTQRAIEGDTLAVGHGVLAEVIASEIEDYKLEINQASTFETKGFAFAEATRVFYAENEDYIEITVGDYVANPDFIQLILKRYNEAQNQKSAGIWDRKLPFPPAGKKEHFFAWESLDENQGAILVNISVDYRYVISISVTGVKEFIPLDRLTAWVDLGKLFLES